MDVAVWGFFYGGLISPAIMQSVGFSPRTTQVASLAGFEIDFTPLVNLRPEPLGMVYGLLMQSTHAELDAVYARLATRYYPYPVLATDASGWPRPALCYLAHGMAPGERDRANIQSIIDTLKVHGVPDWYLSKLAGFLPPA